MMSVVYVNGHKFSTNLCGKGVWRDDKQICGTCDYITGTVKHPDEKLRRWANRYEREV